MNPLDVLPSPRQQNHQALEFYGFLHFGMNTFTNREWGDGEESPSLFAPGGIDARQWVLALKSAGMRGAILTCKHHDGFCLWPSKYTEHSVKNSPCKVDVVREVMEACRKEGLKFGVYLSPWDRHEKTYGQGTAYDDFYVAQLTELLTGYGELFAVWLDGACGEGKNGKRQKYDWALYERTIRELQPGACMCVCGPDVRWCGNEAGQTRPSEWSVVPARLKDAERIQAASQQEDSNAFRQKAIRTTDMDLGSREKMKGEESLIWYPAEVDVSIRPGWFYHKEEDKKVKTAEELYEIYLRSVGGNASLLLNVPPNKGGRIAKEDEDALLNLGEKIQKTFQHPLYEGSLMDGSGLDIRLDSPQKLSMLRLMEDTCFSQRVEAFEVTVSLAGNVVKMFSGTTVGYQRLLPLGGATADRVDIRITETRGEPKMSRVGLYGI